MHVRLARLATNKPSSSMVLGAYNCNNAVFPSTPTPICGTRKTIRR